jgi:PhnB protein
MMTSINPYLNFDGNCEQAFDFYRSVFGGEYLELQRFKDVPPEAQLPAAEGERIMHVALPIGGGTVLMGSDRPSSMGTGTFGNNYHVSIQAEDDAETDKLFNGLSAGGQVTMPLQQTFWGARFGMFVDKFGVQWMINQSVEE